MKLEKVEHQNKLLALILRQGDASTKVEFYTQPKDLLQVGKHVRPKGEIIKPHRHVPVKVTIDENLEEVLYIERGKVKVNFYLDNGRRIDSKIITAGDIIYLKSGGHGFEFLEETRMVEVKQGPYIPESRQTLDTKE